MLTPRLTNCQDCHKIPDLLKQIDCKLAELSNDAYNDIVFMLGNCIPAYEINQLLAYKRILTFKYCNPHYAGSYSVNDIASKVIRLTAGCVSRCNEPTVCEITTCCVDVVPNPTTTTTSTSSTSTTTTSTSSTTTTTTTIYPDCRVEGCFEELITTTTTSTSSTTTTTTTTEFIPDITNNSYGRTANEGGEGCDSGDYPYTVPVPISPSTQATRVSNLTVTWEDIEYVEIVNVTSSDSNITITYNGITVTSGTQIVPTGSSTWEYDFLMEIDAFSCTTSTEIWETRVKLTGYPISNTASSTIRFITDQNCTSCS